VLRNNGSKKFQYKITAKKRKKHHFVLILWLKNSTWAWLFVCVWLGSCVLSKEEQLISSTW
jgi:hypothetical protein